MKEKSGSLKILFFGLGSIGKRHARLIKENYDYEIYAYRTKKGQERDVPKIQTFEKIEDAFAIKPDIAFITNPTYLHVPTALECARRGINLFIEKPISHNLEKLDVLENEIKKRNLFSYVAYNMRFHPVLINMKKLIQQNGKPFYFRVTCSSYLPHWRPNQDYSKSYSANTNEGEG